MKKTRECTYSVRFFERVLVDRSNNTVAILKSQRTLHKMATDKTQYCGRHRLNLSVLRLILSRGTSKELSLPI